MVSAVEFANPALSVAAMLCIACGLLLQARQTTLAWILLGFSLALKPQLAIGPAAILFWRRTTRPAAIKACAVAILLLFAGLAAYRLRLGSFLFLASLRYALWLSSMAGGSSDFANDESFDFLNIQTTFGAIPSVPRLMVQALAWLTTAGLAAISLLVGRRLCAVNRRPWTMIALATAISVLPVYHCGYDRVVALVLIPATMESAAHALDRQRHHPVSHPQTLALQAADAGRRCRLLHRTARQFVAVTTSRSCGPLGSIVM